MAGYGDDSGLEAYADANGYDIPETVAFSVLRQKGSAYLDGSYEDRFIGVRAGGYAQERAWPRTNAVMYGGQSIPDDIIPQAVIDASYEAAIHEALNPGALNKAYTPGEQKVLTEVKGIKWTVTGDASEKGAMMLILTSVEGKLRPLMRPARQAAFLVV